MGKDDRRQGTKEKLRASSRGQAKENSGEARAGGEKRSEEGSHEKRARRAEKHHPDE